MRFATLMALMTLSQWARRPWPDGDYTWLMVFSAIAAIVEMVACNWGSPVPKQINQPLKGE